MKINQKWLEEKKACDKGIAWFSSKRFQTDRGVISALIVRGKLSWASWAIIRLMKRNQRLAYTIFTAEQVNNISILSKIAVTSDIERSWARISTADWVTEINAKVRILEYGFKLMKWDIGSNGK